MGIVSSVNDCQEYAISQNSSVFGVQNSKDCYIGNSINDALKYSEATNCSNMGGPLANQIYSIEGIPQPTYKYLNCYNDDSKVHAVPDLLGTVKNIYDCEVLAKIKLIHYMHYKMVDNVMGQIILLKHNNMEYKMISQNVLH